MSEDYSIIIMIKEICLEIYFTAITNKSTITVEVLIFLNIIIYKISSKYSSSYKSNLSNLSSAIYLVNYKEKLSVLEITEVYYKLMIFSNSLFFTEDYLVIITFISLKVKECSLSTSEVHFTTAVIIKSSNIITEVLIFLDIIIYKSAADYKKEELQFTKIKTKINNKYSIFYKTDLSSLSSAVYLIN